MIYYLRRYLLTLVVLIVVLIWGVPTVLVAVGVTAAFLFDQFVTRRSNDLPLYRAGLDFSAPAPAMKLRDSIRLQLLAIILSVSVALVPRAFDVELAVQQVFNVMALLICGGVASYCGYAVVAGPAGAPRQLLYNSRTYTGDVGFAIDFLPSRPRALMSGLIQLLGSAFFMFFFLIIIAGLHTVELDLTLALILLGCGFLFQLGFQCLFHALFLLRWWRRPHDILPPWHPLVRDG